MDNHLRIATASLFWGCTLSFIPSAVGQSDEVLTARTAKNTVFIDVDPKAKDVRLIGNTTNDDDVLWEYATKEAEPLILISDNTYNMRLRVSNPLRYQVSVKGKEYEEDKYNSAKVLGDFANTAQQIINIVTRGAMPYGSVAESELRELVSADGADSKPHAIDHYHIDLTNPAPKEKIAGTDEIRDYGLRRAMMLYAITDVRDEWATDDDSTGRTATREVLEKLAKAAKNVEELAENNMLADATTIVQGLMKVDLSTESATKGVHDLDALIDSLELRNTRMNKALKEAAKLRTPPTEQNSSSGTGYGLPWAFDLDWLNADAKADPEESKVKYALRFVELSLEEFVDRMDQLLRQRETLVDNLNRLLNAVQSVHADLSKTEHGTDLIYGEPIPAGQVEKVTITVRERNVTVGADYSITMKEADLFTRQLKFMRAHTFYPQLFPAAVFINAVYPEFNAQEDSSGVQRVNKKDNTQGYLNVAGMVNFNFKLDRKTEVPFIQLGASAKKSQPQVFIGGGIRFTEWLGISVGAAFTWQGSLTNLQEGQQITGQDVINKDLRYTMSDPQFYFGIQLRPSTLTKKAD